jgi:PAS domain S-box-containing protein
MANDDVQKTLAELSQELQESKARLEEAQRVAHVGHWEWDLATDVIVWSDETYRIFGLSPQERPMDLATVRSMVHPDDREPLYQAVDQDLVAGQRPSGEFRIVRPSGEVRTVSSLTSERWSSLPGDTKRDASGRPHKLFGTIQDITERKRTEEAFQEISRKLLESNARLEEAQRVAHVGYWVWDLQTNRVIWSDETYRIFGLTPQEGLIDLDKVREMIHPDDREAVFRTAGEAVRSGARADCEHRLFRPDGEMRIVHSLGDLKKDSSGRPCQMFGTTQDITDRKRAQEALLQTQIYLREGQRLARMGSWAFNDSGLYWSDELYQIFGLDPEKGAPKIEQYLTLIHPQDQAAMAETIKTMFQEHRGCDDTKRIVRPDGQVRYVRCVASPVIEQEVFKGFIGTAIDVTEQELLTQELRREQAYLAEAQSLAHIGSWATNLATRQNFHLSDETYRIHGFDPRQGPPGLERFWDTLHPEDEPWVRATLEDAVRKGTDYDIRDFRICRADDGQIRFLRTIGHRNPVGEIGEYVGITMDITELKRAEEERERLRQLEADLAHINRVNMMGELAAALAHEIRQPIAASITSANACLRWLARDPPDLERARAAAARIEQDGNRAAEVINRLRSFYMKGVPPEREMVDIKEIVREMTALLRREAVRHSIKIYSELGEDLPNVLVDRVQLQQVFMNLMLNAIEAMKGRGGRLTISSRSTPQGHVTVSIGDTGVGLSVENTERIFDAFHTTKPQGTGMGLAITRSIVDAHGGRVWATVNPEAGATFHFTLPAKTEAET